MIKTIFRHIKIFFLLHSFGAGKDLSLRGNFLVTMIGSLCFFYLHLIGFKLVISRFSFFNWSDGQLWVLLYTFQIFTYLSFYVLWRGLNNLPKEINIGGFDSLLTKPINSRFISFFRNGSLHNLISALLGVGYLISAFYKFNYQVSVVGIFLYLLTMLISIWIFHCASVILTTLNFSHGYLPATSASLFEVQEIFKYPASAFSFRSVWQQLLIYPLALLTTIPAIVILSKPIPLKLILIYLVSLFLLTYLSNRNWKNSLLRYSSASS